MIFGVSRSALKLARGLSTLYKTDWSPGARAVRILAKSLDLELDTRDLQILENEHLKPGILKLNPTHTVPILVEEDGFVLWDSHAILTYLVDKYSPGHPFYPTDLRKRAIINERLHFDSGTLFSRGLAITKQFLFLGGTEIPEEKVEALKEAFGFVETFLTESKYVAGDEITVADISFFTSITSFALVVQFKETDYPKISAWIKEMESYPFTAINQKGIEVIRSLLQAKMAALAAQSR